MTGVRRCRRPGHRTAERTGLIGPARPCATYSTIRSPGIASSARPIIPASPTTTPRLRGCCSHLPGHPRRWVAKKTLAPDDRFPGAQDLRDQVAELLGPQHHPGGRCARWEPINRSTTKETHEQHQPQPKVRRTRGLSAAATTLALAIGAVALPAGTASAAPPECAAAQPGGPVQVTTDCVDPLYANPVVDSEQDLTAPVTRHGCWPLRGDRHPVQRLPSPGRPMAGSLLPVHLPDGLHARGGHVGRGRPCDGVLPRERRLRRAGR